MTSTVPTNSVPAWFQELSAQMTRVLPSAEVLQYVMRRFAEPSALIIHQSVRSVRAHDDDGVKLSPWLLTQAMCSPLRQAGREWAKSRVESFEDDELPGRIPDGNVVAHVRNHRVAAC